MCGGFNIRIFIPYDSESYYFLLQLLWYYET